jgi:hypothetical protein
MEIIDMAVVDEEEEEDAIKEKDAHHKDVDMAMIRKKKTQRQTGKVDCKLRYMPASKSQLT